MLNLSPYFSGSASILYVLGIVFSCSGGCGGLSRLLRLCGWYLGHVLFDGVGCSVCLTAKVAVGCGLVLSGWLFRSGYRFVIIFIYQCVKSKLCVFSKIKFAKLLSAWAAKGL